MTPNSEYVYEDTFRREMVPLIPLHSRRVLDVGCGRGRFGAGLKADREVEIWGIESSVEAAEHARQRLDKVLVADVEDDVLPLPERHFDCIACMDILEHLTDPWAFLKRARNWLADGGAIVASIPNVRHHSVLKALLIDRTWRYSDSGILDRTHLRFFTISAVRDLFESSGYAIEHLQGINGTKSWQFKLANLATMRLFDDARHPQIACVARPTAG